MRICLAVYGDRLAALLENAEELRLYAAAEGRAEPAGVRPAPRGDPEALIRAIVQSGTDALLCGAVCRRLRLRLEQAGLTVTPWLGGPATEVLTALLEDRLETCRLPGCGGRRRCGRRRGNGGR